MPAEPNCLLIWVFLLRNQDVAAPVPAVKTASCAGLTTKARVVVDAKGRPFKVMITGGQQHKRRMARALPEGLLNSGMVLATMRLWPRVNAFTAWASAEKGAGNESRAKRMRTFFKIRILLAS